MKQQEEPLWEKCYNSLWAWKWHAVVVIVVAAIAVIVYIHRRAGCNNFGVHGKTDP